MIFSLHLARISSILRAINFLTTILMNGPKRFSMYNLYLYLYYGCDCLYVANNTPRVSCKNNYDFLIVILTLHFSMWQEEVILYCFSICFGFLDTPKFMFSFCQALECYLK